MYLDDDLLLSIDELSKSMGMSRNASVVWCLRHCQSSMDEISKAARKFEELPENVMAQVVNAFGQSGWLLNDELTRVLRKQLKANQQEKPS